MPAALVLLLALQASPAPVSPASVSVPQLSETQRAGVASVVADSPSLASTSTRARGELAAAPTQLGDAGRTAEASADLSTRAQGRAVGAGAIGGRDSCDPAYGAAGTELCRRRLEARAGEFGVTGAAPVSAEARLLILSDPQPGPQSVDGMTRRLGATTGVDALAGSAANTLAGAIAGGRTDAPSTTGAAAGAAGALPAGVPSTVLVTPH